MTPITKQLLSIMQATSIINGVLDAKGIFEDQPNIACFKTDYSLTNPLLYGANWDFGSIASSFSKNEAIERATLRTAAKYSLFSLQSYTFFHSPFSMIKKDAIDPTTLIELTNPKARTDNNAASSYGWTKCTNLITKKQAYIPAQYIYPVYYSYITYKTDLEEPYLINQRQIINGRGIGSTLTVATLEALYEAIETDAWTSMYIAKQIPHLVHLDSIKDKECRKLLSICLRHNLMVHILDITTSLGVPVFAATIVDQKAQRPAISTGLGVGYNKYEAIANALKHALSVRLQHIAGIRAKRKLQYINSPEACTFGATPIQKGASIPIKEWRYLRHVFNKDLPALDLPITKNISESEALKKLLTTLKQHNFAVWKREVTDPIFAAQNVKVIKVFIPGLQEKLVNNNIGDVGVIERRQKNIQWL